MTVSSDPARPLSRRALPVQRLRRAVLILLAGVLPAAFAQAVADPWQAAAGEGVAIMSVDNLPTALPRDASVDFSKALIKVIRPFFKANLRDGLGALTPAQQNAVVVAAGKLGPKHTGLQRFL